MNQFICLLVVGLLGLGSVNAYAVKSHASPNRLGLCQTGGQPVCATNGRDFFFFENICRLNQYNYGQATANKPGLALVTSNKCFTRCDRIICPLLRAPVCVQEVTTKQVMTLPNKCELNRLICSTKSYWTIVSNTACEKRCTEVCPALYRPICAVYYGEWRTFSNECEMHRYSCLHNQKWLPLGLGTCKGRIELQKKASLGEQPHQAQQNSVPQSGTVEAGQGTASAGLVSPTANRTPEANATENVTQNQPSSVPSAPETTHSAAEAPASPKPEAVYPAKQPQAEAAPLGPQSSQSAEYAREQPQSAPSTPLVPAPCESIRGPVCAVFAGIRSTFANACDVDRANALSNNQWVIDGEGPCIEPRAAAVGNDETRIPQPTATRVGGQDEAQAPDFRPEPFLMDDSRVGPESLSEQPSEVAPTLASAQEPENTLSAGSSLEANSNTVKPDLVPEPCVDGELVPAPAQDQQQQVEGPLAPGQELQAEGPLAPRQELQAEGPLAPGQEPQAEGPFAPRQEQQAEGSLAPRQESQAEGPLAPGQEPQAKGALASVQEPQVIPAPETPLEPNSNTAVVEIVDDQQISEVPLSQPPVQVSGQKAQPSLSPNSNAAVTEFVPQAEAVPAAGDQTMINSNRAVVEPLPDSRHSDSSEVLSDKSFTPFPSFYPYGPIFQGPVYHQPSYMQITYAHKSADSSGSFGGLNPAGQSSTAPSYPWQNQQQWQSAN